MIMDLNIQGMLIECGPLYTWNYVMAMTRNKNEDEECT